MMSAWPTITYYDLANGQSVCVIQDGDYADLEYVRDGEVERFRAHVPMRTVRDLVNLESWRLRDVRV